MTMGSYDAGTGEVELQPVHGEPEVFVIAGNGTGKAVFRKLQRKGIPFAAGILWENDLDYPSAKALAQAVVSIPPFESIQEEQLMEAKKWIDSCEKVILTMDLSTVGEMAGKLAKLCDYAKVQGKM